MPQYKLINSSTLNSRKLLHSGRKWPKTFFCSKKHLEGLLPTLVPKQKLRPPRQRLVHMCVSKDDRHRPLVNQWHCPQPQLRQPQGLQLPRMLPHLVLGVEFKEERFRALRLCLGYLSLRLLPPKPSRRRCSPLLSNSISLSTSIRRR